MEIPVAFAVYPAEEEQGHACAICQTAIAAGERVGRCPRCHAPYHAECWEENGGCASYGCPLTPVAAKEVGPAEGSSFWGQEDKECPACGRRIRLAALRCRHCGRTFETRAPAPPFRSPPPPTGAAGVWIFVAGLLPPTAPLVLILGGPLLWLRRRHLRRWPATRRAMAVMGIVASALVTLLVGGGVLLHRATSTPAHQTAQAPSAQPRPLPPSSGAGDAGGAGDEEQAQDEEQDEDQDDEEAEQSAE
jgi:hypothetical protein